MINERVAITGASSGIGKDMAFEVARSGGTPILLARSENKLKQISTEIQQETGVAVPFFCLDVSNHRDVQKTFQIINEQIGAVTILINNAGFAVFDSVIDAEIDDAEAMFQVNVLGTISCTKEVLPSMINNKRGHIIFIASQSAKLATPKSSVYSATKHAVLGFANALRLELHDDPVHISVVNPGPIRTNFFDTADKTGEYEKNVERFMLESKDVAKKTVQLIDKPKRELNLPSWMGIGTKLYQLFPALIEKIAGKQLRQK